MVDRVEEQFDIKPERLIGDTAYGTAPMLAWMVEDKDIKPHVPGWDTPSARTTVSLTTISTGMRRLRNTAAQLATHCAASGEPRNVDAFGVARPGVDLARTTCHEFFCEGKTDTTVGAGSECNGIFQSRRDALAAAMGIVAAMVGALSVARATAKARPEVSAQVLRGVRPMIDAALGKPV